MQTEIGGLGSQQSLIMAMIRSELQLSPYSELRNIHCSLESGVLVLSGNVPAYYYKQIAQSHSLKQSNGQLPVENRILVKVETK